MGLLQGLIHKAIRKEVLRLLTAYKPLLNAWGVRVVSPDRFVTRVLEVYDAQSPPTPPTVQ